MKSPVYKSQYDKDSELEQAIVLAVMDWIDDVEPSNERRQDARRATRKSVQQIIADVAGRFVFPHQRRRNGN